jgi:hypothetical protein
MPPPEPLRGIFYKNSSAVFIENGGDRDRTDNPLLAKQVLYQLSYTPNHKPVAA